MAVVKDKPDSISERLVTQRARQSGRIANLTRIRADAKLALRERYFDVALSERAVYREVNLAANLRMLVGLVYPNTDLLLAGRMPAFSPELFYCNLCATEVVNELRK